MDKIDPELDESLDQIANSIFTRIPQEPKSIKLELELESDENNTNILYKDGIDQSVFNILFLVTYKGIKILFNHDNLLSLTKDQYNLLQKYVNSFGYILEVYGNNTEKTNEPKTPWELLENNINLTNCTIAFKSLTL